jgi:hypothetical protein
MNRPNPMKLWASRRPRLIIFLSVFVFLALFTHHKVFLAGNDTSRFAQIESIVDYGKTTIEQSKYSWTIDRVTLDGKEYSNKPPSLSIIGSRVYFVLKKIFGLTFRNNESLTIYLLTLLLVGIGTVWLDVKFYSSLEMHQNIPRNIRNITTFTLAAGTLLTSFSVTFNNHTIAVALIFAAFCDTMSHRSFRAGTWISLAMCVDVVPGILFIPVFAIILAKEKGWAGLLRYVSAVSIGGILFLSLNLWIAGHPLPPKLIPGGLDHSSQYASVVQHVPLPKNWIYPLQCLFGWHGFFTVSPVLLFGAIGLGMAIKQKTPFNRKIRFISALPCWSCFSATPFLLDLSEAGHTASAI